jgi:hypothetical protein
MDFVLNGRTRSLDVDTVRLKVAGLVPGAIRTHWVRIDDRDWPPKQALRLAVGLRSDEPFVTHYAIRIFQRLGFTTSAISLDAASEADVPPIVEQVARQSLTDGDALEAFSRLDAFLASNPLTATLTHIEQRLLGADRSEAARVAESSGLDVDLVDSALVVRERIGMLDSLIHAAVITQVLPLILNEGEKVLKQPSLGAGNDPDRRYDLETTHRVAEFKLSSWKGADGMRQRGLFADVVGLSLDDTGRQRQVFVVGQLPVRFLTTSQRVAAKILSKAALRLRTPPGICDSITVSDYTKTAQIEVIDLTTMLANLR